MSAVDNILEDNPGPSPDCSGLLSPVQLFLFGAVQDPPGTRGVGILAYCALGAGMNSAK